MSVFANSTFSAYIAFCKVNRDEVKAANPGAQFGDMGRLLRARWNKMSDREKAVYSKPRQVQVDSSTNVQSEHGVRRSSRLRNKRLGLDFWGLKIKNEK